jgi:hypothetical protein
MRAGRLALVVATVVLCAWCGWVSGYHRTSTNAEITWAVSLAAVVLVDLALWRGRSGRRFGWHVERVQEPWPRQGRGGSGGALRGTTPWLMLILVAVAWDVLGIDTAPNRYHLTISALSQAYRPLNAAVLLVWMLAGVGYEVARVRAPVALPHGRSTPARTSPPPSEEGTMFGAAALAAPGHAAAPALLLPNSPPAGIAFWVALPLVALLVDAAARRSSGRVATAEEFVRFIATNGLVRLTLVAAWVFAGYHLFAR